jgi:hypothetical protein
LDWRHGSSSRAETPSSNLNTSKKKKKLVENTELHKFSPEMSHKTQTSEYFLNDVAKNNVKDTV